MTLKEVLTEYQNRVNDRLKQAIDNLPVVAPKLKEAMSYGTLLGGKRVRPFLVYATAKAVGADLSVADAPAVAIECVHAYSLIHDDLPAMDDDDLRRGHPTVHKKYGEATGVLSGVIVYVMSTQPTAINGALNQRTGLVLMNRFKLLLGNLSVLSLNIQFLTAAHSLVPASHGKNP